MHSIAQQAQNKLQVLQFEMAGHPVYVFVLSAPAGTLKHELPHINENVSVCITTGTHQKQTTRRRRHREGWCLNNAINDC